MDSRKIEIGIFDDEPDELVRIGDEVKRSLDALNEDEMEVHLFLNAEEMYEDSHKRSYSLVFLDLKIPELKGFELARLLYMGNQEVKVVFVSSHESMVFDAYEYMPLWFVRKSQLTEDIRRALRKYFQITLKKRLNFRIKLSFGVKEVLVSEILYIECAGHKLTVKLVNSISYQVYGSLKKVETELSRYGFLRIHKNYLVNQMYIKEIRSRTVVLGDGTELDMGKNRKKAILSALNQYV